MTRAKSSSQPDPSRLRQSLRQNQELGARQVEVLLGERGPIIRGSYLRQSGRCGKPSCRCARGETHERAVLYRSAGGVHTGVYVPQQERALVGERNARYQSFRKARAALAKLGKQTLELASQLEDALVEPYPPPERVARKTASGRKGRRKGSST